MLPVTQCQRAALATRETTSLRTCCLGSATTTSMTLRLWPHLVLSGKPVCWLHLCTQHWLLCLPDCLDCVFSNAHVPDNQSLLMFKLGAILLWGSLPKQLVLSNLPTCRLHGMSACKWLASGCNLCFWLLSDFQSATLAVDLHISCCRSIAEPLETMQIIKLFAAGCTPIIMEPPHYKPTQPLCQSCWK